jgi:hypothetical protein
MRYRNVVTVAVLMAVMAVAAAAAPPTPPPRKPQPTGYDIAIVNLRSTGPRGTVPNALVATFKNVGKKTINHTLLFQYWINGGFLTGRYIPSPLAPGETYVSQPNPIEAGFAKFGDTAEGLIDADHKLAEDNESNNRMTKVLVRPVVMQRH